MEDDRVLEIAEKYGYCGMFSHRKTLQEAVDWATNLSDSGERLAAVTAAMLVLNTVAILRAKEDIENGKV